ncbi:hypothetical protein [Clostridium sp. ZS2-4]|uniref:hypothetical protein n=1 Tax=Clostridium sp. ZS2-4 TaxID=2987703 RepID=UPI00227C5B72|nr:hypothetical protein [Clostridium sp. ZS2-4]MCY6354355.1 hypothetical protein [Clostridium sp. ZS2-4]
MENTKTNTKQIIEKIKKEMKNEKKHLEEAGLDEKTIKELLKEKYMRILMERDKGTSRSICSRFIDSILKVI